MPGYSTYLATVDPLNSESLSLTSVVTHAGGPIELKCNESLADVDVFGATLNAIKVDSLG